MAEHMKIELHPLVVMNVSEHFTRVKYRREPGSKGYRVIGILLGRQSGHTIEIMNSFELKFENTNPADPTAKQISIDMDFC